MVNQRINSLPKPIKWFSVPRLFRAERPQKGRLREFFQWNIDIIGEDSVLADAEVIFTTVDFLREIGLTSNDIKVKISSRKLLADYLANLGITEDKLESIYAILDKKAKLPPETFEEILKEQIPDISTAKKIMDFMSVDSIPKLKEFVEDKSGAYIDIKSVIDNLNMMGVGDFCVYDPSIVRGLAYYTGIVFEIHDVAGELRAICGGGRYDNLLHDFGGPKISATGMGMGDCVLEILLRERGILEKQLTKQKLFCFVACADESYRDTAIQTTMRIRSSGFSANFSYKVTKLGKQLKQASEQNAEKCIIIGDEFKDKKLIIKDMASGEQKLVDYDEFLSGFKP
jgi:histidyl-tRNA synthetase